MQTVLIVIHLMVVIALVGVVLLQRSEGGGLGIGGGSGFMTARGAANALTRATGILAIAFFATSLGLSLLARYGERPMDIFDRAPVSGEQNGGAAGSGSGSGGVLDKLGGNNKAAPPAANGGTPAPSGESKPANPAPAPAPASPAVPNSQ
jgi:preprotein translocase subunit SecG